MASAYASCDDDDDGGCSASASARHSDAEEEQRRRVAEFQQHRQQQQTPSEMYYAGSYDAGAHSDSDVVMAAGRGTGSTTVHHRRPADGVEAFYQSASSHPSQDTFFHPPPVAGEDSHTVVFPEFVGDQGAAATNAEHISARQRAAFERRYNTYFWRFLRGLEWWGLIPDKWCAVEGEKYPKYVVFIEQRWKGWVARWSMLSMVLWLLWLFVSWMLERDTAVFSDGSIVENLYKPRVVKVRDMTDMSFARWLNENRAHGSAFKPANNYNPVPTYDTGDFRNVTTSWLTESLYTACRGNAKPDSNDYDPDECVCMPAVEIGIFANVVLLDDKILYNPQIIRESDKRALTRHEDGSEEMLPVSIDVLYELPTGKMKREFVDGVKSGCLFQAVRLVKGS